MKLSDKEKEKTIKCLLKVLQLQVKQVEVQASELIDQAKVNDRELEQVRIDMLEHERKLKLDELNQQLEKTKRIAGSYKQSDELISANDEQQDLAEIIADN